MSDESGLCKSLHAAYNQAAGRDLPLDGYTMFRWREFISRGGTEHDLRLVIRFILHKIKRGERRLESLRLHLLLDPDRFADDLQDARMWQRQRPAQPARDAVLRASRRPAQESKPVMSVEQVMANHAQMAALLKEYRESL